MTGTEKLYEFIPLVHWYLVVQHTRQHVTKLFVIMIITPEPPPHWLSTWKGDWSIILQQERRPRRIFIMKSRRGLGFRRRKGSLRHRGF